MNPCSVLESHVRYAIRYRNTNGTPTDQYKLLAILGGKNKIRLLNNVVFYVNIKQSALEKCNSNIEGNSVLMT